MESRKLLWIVACLLFVRPPARAQTPVVDCVVLDPATSNYVAYFGYTGNLNGSVTIPLGSNNQVSGMQIFGLPPTVFSSQAAHILFAIQFASTGTASWTLNSQTASASSANLSVPACQLAVGVTLSNSAFDRCWNTQANLGAGKMCTQTEDVDGDGFCTVLDCTGATGAIGPAGATGNTGQPGSPGPAATTPALKTYTAAPGTANATASCGAREFLVTGGGTCTVPNLPNMGRVAASSPTADGSGWMVACNAGQASVVTVCAPQQ